LVFVGECFVAAVAVACAPECFLVVVVPAGVGAHSSAVPVAVGRQDLHYLCAGYFQEALVASFFRVVQFDLVYKACVMQELRF
jgi:hypothetical protein